MILEIILASFAVMLVSLLGVVTIWLHIGSFIEKNLNYLVSFGAGVFLLLVFVLSEEVILHGTTPISGFLWIMTGLISVWFLSKLLPETHHHHTEYEEHRHNRVDARKLLIGDGLHNVGDGILLAAAFLTSSTLGFAAALSILFHELVQEISEFFVLRQAGYSTKAALKINFLTSSTILIGSVGGFFLLDQFALLEIPILGLAAGALLALLLDDLLPHSVKHAKEKNCAHKHIFAVVLGAFLMFSIVTVTANSDAHTHGAEDTLEHAEDDHE